jgi:poly(3-hydroxyalkanoate) depolymerase
MARFDGHFSGTGGAAYSDKPRVTMEEIEGQRIRVAVRIVDASRPPLLMFNGIGASLDMAEPLMAEMSRTSTVIFDIPGIGGSPMPVRPYRLSCMAKLAHALMGKLGYSRFDVAGVSWGGALAQQMAYQYPDACRKLVLAATATGLVMVPGNPWILAKLMSPRRYADHDYLQSIAGDLYGGSFRAQADLAARHPALKAGTGGEAYHLQLRALLGWTSIFWLSSLRQPTLIMAGIDDPLVPVANAFLMAFLIPRARISLIPEGHLFLITDPHRSALTIEDFLLEAGEASAGLPPVHAGLTADTVPAF